MAEEGNYRDPELWEIAQNSARTPEEMGRAIGSVGLESPVQPVLHNAEEDVAGTDFGLFAQHLGPLAGSSELQAPAGVDYGSGD